MTAPTNGAALVRLALAIAEGETVRTAAFARQEGISQRSVQRYMAIVESVLPLACERGHGRQGWRKVAP